MHQSSRKISREKADCPLSSWINSLYHRTGLSLRYARSRDRARISHGTDQVIRMFYTYFERFGQSFSPQYIFVADETMVNAVKGVK
jgi:hypothetical protein